jgi:hypothetical protein
MWIIDLSPRDIDSATLSTARRMRVRGLLRRGDGRRDPLARDGRRIGEIRNGFRGELETQRPAAIAALQRMHLAGDDLRRTTDNTLNLQIAFGHFLHFALKSVGDHRRRGDEAARRVLDRARALGRAAGQASARRGSGVAFLPAAALGAVVQRPRTSAPPTAASPARRSTWRAGTAGAARSFWEPGGRASAATPPTACASTPRRASASPTTSSAPTATASVSARRRRWASTWSRKVCCSSALSDDRHGRRTDRQRIGGELRMVWRVPHDALGIPGPSEGGVFRARTAHRTPRRPTWPRKPSILSEKRGWNREGVRELCARARLLRAHRRRKLCARRSEVRTAVFSRHLKQPQGVIAVVADENAVRARNTPLDFPGRNSGARMQPKSTLARAPQPHYTKGARAK